VSKPDSNRNIWRSRWQRLQSKKTAVVLIMCATKPGQQNDSCGFLELVRTRGIKGEGLIIRNIWRVVSGWGRWGGKIKCTTKEPRILRVGHYPPKNSLQRTLLCLKAFSVHNTRTTLVVFVLWDPHILEGGQGRQNGSSNPNTVFTLRRCYNLYLHWSRCECGQFFL